MQSTHLFLFRIVVYLRAAAYLTGDSNLSKPLRLRPDDHGSEDDADYGDESELFRSPSLILTNHLAIIQASVVA